MSDSGTEFIRNGKYSEFIQQESTETSLTKERIHCVPKRHARRIKKRIVHKNGDANVIFNSFRNPRILLQDIYTILVELQWRSMFCVVGVSLVLSWFTFACFWFLISYAHGDIDYFNLKIKSEDVEVFKENNKHIPCVTGMTSLLVAFMFSVETQTTIGYGWQYLTEECPEAIFLMCIQGIFGVAMNAFIVGIAIAKLLRPKKRAQTLLFSKNAVISQRDGVPCFMFRVGDMRKNHIIEAQVRAQIIRKKKTKEGEFLPYFQYELEVGADGSNDSMMFVWPTIIIHKIDQTSPMYDLLRHDYPQEKFEIVVIIEGIVEATGNTTQATSSYMPSEILWGHQFEPTVQFKRDAGVYEVDYTKFDNTCEAKK